MKKTISFLIASMLAFTFAKAQQPVAPPAPAISAKAADEPNSAGQFTDGSDYVNPSFTYKIIDAPNHTFGYEVFTEGHMIIHQANVPGRPGNDGFKSRTDAEKVARLVLQKISRGGMPSISADELENMKVNN